MNLFETVKQAVSPMEAVCRYGIPVNRGGKICCPFHEERTPSLKLYDDHFYCFGCGATGDVIRLTAQILDLRPYDAAKQLARDFGLDPPPQGAVVCVPKVRNTEKLYRRFLMDYANLLRRHRRDYAPGCPGEEPDDRYVQACQELPYMEDLLDSLDRNPTETMKILQADDLMHRIARTLDREDSRCAA